MPLVEFLGQPRSRPNLVIVRAGDGSAHNRWIRDLPAADRSWNLLVSFFGRNVDALRPPYEMLSRHPGPKWPAMAELYDSGELPPFDHVWCVDDDVECSWSDINRLFQLVADYDLDLAQPALDPDSYVSHRFLVASPDRVVRYTSFVEVMAPVFTREAFAVCNPPMREAVTGWGLDFVWPRLLGDPRDRIGVVHAVPVRHIRPVGSHYRQLDAEAEMTALMARYGVQWKIVNYGAAATPRPRRRLGCTVSAPYTAREGDPP